MGFSIEVLRSIDNTGMYEARNAGLGLGYRGEGLGSKVSGLWCVRAKGV